MRQTYDVHVEQFIPLVSPDEIKQELPITAKAEETVINGRDEIKKILSGEDSRLMVIAGPCSVHEEGAALDYANKLYNLKEQVKETLCLIMRVYFEKPRTTIGWKGMINDPDMNGSCDIMTGIRRARKLLITITEMGLPTATEFLDPIIPQYLAGLICWTAIGARTTESQTHREMSSGLSMPVGFKNCTDGNLTNAINAILAAKSCQSFLGIDPNGKASIVKTRGNPYTHVVLRGGKRPNYDSVSIREALQALKSKGLEQAVIVDCSHANSGKKCEGQSIVWQDVLDQREHGNLAIKGLMLESNLNQGSQKICEDPGLLEYGVSVTDECISWEETEALILKAHEQMKKAMSY